MAAIDEGEHHDLWEAFARGLSARDRALANFLLQGTLRHRPHVDGALSGVLKQPIDTLDIAARATLRVGAYEALYGRTPRRAIVHQFVEASKRVGAGRAKGLVNAVLRRVQPLENPTGEALHGHPDWLMRRWEDRYGLDAARAWAASNQEPAATSIVSRSGAAPPQALLEAGLDLTPGSASGSVVPGVYTLPERHGAVGKLPGYREGLFWVQDPAAAAVADLVPVPSDKRVLDACAAPGGKAFRLAFQGAQVTAVDRGGDRLSLIKANAKRLRTSIKMVKHDWLRGPCPNLGTFHSVLLDAPCTGLGTIRRHPEIRWRRAESDLSRCHERQVGMLEAVAQHVAPGGHLVYSVCSVEPEETEDVMRRFEDIYPQWQRDTIWCSAAPKQGEDAHFAVRWRASE